MRAMATTAGAPATEYVRAFAGQIGAFIPQAYMVLDSDGFGRPDTRANLRRFYEVDRSKSPHTVIAALVVDGKMTGKDCGQGDQAVQDRCGEG